METGKNKPLSVSYPAYLVATKSLLTSMGNFVVAHEKNDRLQNRKVQEKASAGQRPGGAFEDHLARPALFALRQKKHELAYKKMIHDANKVLRSHAHTIKVKEVRIVLPPRTKKGKKVAEPFYDFYFDMTLTDGDKRRKLAVPVNVKWSDAKGPEHTSAGKMIQWILGLFRSPSQIKSEKVCDVEQMMAVVLKEGTKLSRGQLTLGGEPDCEEVPTDYHFLVFNKPGDGAKWTTEAHATSLLAVEPTEGIVWTASERWPQINMRFHSPQISGKIPDGHEQAFDASFAARRLVLLRWFVLKKCEAHEASPLVQASRNLGNAHN